jgi:hypothetical protein
MEKIYRLRANLLTVIGEPKDGKCLCALGGREIGLVPIERFQMQHGNDASLDSVLLRIVGAEQDGMIPCELVADNTPLRIPDDELIEFKVGPE